jgi:hypothetical protein
VGSVHARHSNTETLNIHLRLADCPPPRRRLVRAYAEIHRSLRRNSLPRPLRGVRPPTGVSPHPTRCMVDVLRCNSSEAVWTRIRHEAPFTGLSCYGARARPHCAPPQVSDDIDVSNSTERMSRQLGRMALCFRCGSTRCSDQRQPHHACKNARGLAVPS